VEKSAAVGITTLPDHYIAATQVLEVIGERAERAQNWVRNPAGLVLDAERGVTESGPFDDIERAIVQACPDPVLTVRAEQVLAAAAGLGVDITRFERYADRRWGQGWMRSANGRYQVLDEIERYRNDPEGFADKIDAHLNLHDKPA
jgi:hypothetical protein